MVLIITGCNTGKYTVIFDGDCNNADAYSIPKPIEINAKEKIDILPIAWRAGYDFDGWYTEKDGKGMKLTAYKPTITGNMTVYAKWNRRNQQEFNAYEYSQGMRDLFNDAGYISGYGYHPFELSALVVFSKDELRLLRDKLEKDLQGGFGPGMIPEDYLNAVYRHNIKMVTIAEHNFPNKNETSDQLPGLWCLAYSIPDQGYRRGDYIKIYNNGIFEYISRNFQATRHGNQIYGGSRFGLWTTDTANNQKNELDIEILMIPEIKKPDEQLHAYYGYAVNETISVFNNTWMKVSGDVNVGLDWGYK